MFQTKVVDKIETHSLYLQ